MKTSLKKLQLACLFLCAVLAFGQQNALPIENGTYKIGCSAGSLFLTTGYPTDVLETGFIPRDDNNKFQEWAFVHTGNGQYTINSQVGDLSHAIYNPSGNSCESSTIISTPLNSNEDSFKWSIEKTNNKYIIRSVSCAATAIRDGVSAFLLPYRTGDSKYELTLEQIDIVTTPPTTPTPTIENNYIVRAKGISGNENIRLLINDRIIQTFSLSETFADYTTNTSEDGTIKIEFFNDAVGLDVEVDYLQKNDTRYESENQDINTSVWQDNSCGGSKSSLMQCNGYIEFSNSDRVDPTPTSQLIANGAYRIQSNTNQQFIAAPDNLNVIETNQNNGLDQQWIFEHLGDNVYTISLASSGNRLEVPFGKRANGTIIGTTNHTGSGDHIAWKITKPSDIYLLSPNHDLSKALDIRPRDNKLHIWSIAPNNQNQHWNIIPVAGSKAPQETQDIVISPNPATDYITISGVNKNDSLRIYDIQGRLVSSTVAKALNPDQITYNINSLSKGVYFLKVGLVNTSKKFVKK